MSFQVRHVGRWIGATAALVLIPAMLHAQDRSVTITGHVVGDNGEPLRAANVAISELGLAAYVDADGNYRLVVPGARAAGQEVTLAARMIGKQSRTARVRLEAGASLTQNFTLPADPLRLEEVVVTGAGTEQLAERIGTARASVSGEQLLRANTPENVVTALAGKVPNVITNTGSGDAGASTAIQIRGAKTFGASQPVFIVDGVVMNNNTRQLGSLGGAGTPAPPTSNRIADINPEDIESIEILKGAAATSIYGASAGSAGAVLITTKRGRSGRTEYTVRSNVQTDQPAKYLPVQQKWGMGNVPAGADPATGGVSTLCVTTNCQVAAGNARAWGPPIAAGTPVYDHARDIYETGHLMDNSVSMSGGTDRTSFYLSAGQLDHDGFLVGANDYLKRYTVRFNGSHSVTDDLTFGASGSYVQTNSSGVDRGNSVNGVGLTALRQPPDFNAAQFLDPTTGLHRSFRFPNPGVTCTTRTVASCDRGWDNPFFAINNDKLLNETGRVFGNVNANYHPLSWLQFNGTLGTDYNGEDHTFAFHQTSAGLPNGQFERWQYYDRILDWNLSGTAQHAFSQNVQTSLTVGQNLNETYFRQIDAFGQTWISAQPYKISNITNIVKGNSSDSETRRHVDGYFTQANVDLYDQLFLQARVRNDGSSAFGPGHQRATYPGASAAWSFTKYLKIPEQYISFGKARLAYGESGQQPNLYLTQDVFSTATFADFSPASLQSPIQNGIGGSFASATKGNKDIQPERVRELETGVDLSFLRGKADLSATVYNSKSSGVILSVPIAPSTGYSSISLNAGGLENKGLELSSSIRPYQRGDLSIEIGGQWARNRNTVTSLGRYETQTCSAATQSACAPGTILIPTKENCQTSAAPPRCSTGLGSSFTGQTTNAQVGQPLGVWRATDFARCGISDALVTYGGTQYDVGTACQGQPKGALFIAPNGFPITDGTVRAIGNPWPEWTAGLSSYIEYKGVQVSAFLDHRHGGNVLNMTRASMDQFGTHKDTEIRGQTRTFGKDMLCYNITCDVINGPVVGPGAGTPVVIGQDWFDGPPGPGNGLGSTGGPISTRLEDATNTRLREVSIGYTFKQAWVRKIAGFTALDAKFSARNLGLWTNYSGLDPEVNLGGASNANRGIDFFNTPLTRGYVVSVGLHH
jgi:TonB-linked SusC/RagA family outer membrane protein